MKKYLLATVMFFCVMLGAKAQTGAEKLIGKWECFEAKDAGGAIEFINDSTVILSFKGEKKKITDISIDKTKTPVWFDFSIQEDGGKTNYKSLVGFVNDDLVKWQIFINEPRPAFFSTNSEDVLFMRRKKP